MFLNIIRTRLQALPFWIYILVIFFATVGFFFVAVFIASQYNVFDTLGVRDSQFSFVSASKENKSPTNTNTLSLCLEEALLPSYPYTAIRFHQARVLGYNTETVVRMAEAVKYSLFNTKTKESVETCLLGKKNKVAENTTKDVFAWAETEEWGALASGLAKEKDEIQKVSKITGVNSRKIAAIIVSEQMRLFTSDRALFKQLFGPLRVLGTQTQFSMGITGFKPETASMVEKNLRDTQSPYYLGPKYEHLLDYSEEGSHDALQFRRFADYNNHYWSYLYTALLIKQLETQWQKAGHPIGNRPEIISTLFNIGFKNSIPKENPEVGGAEIEIDGVKYSFGRLSYEFYYSGLLVNEFPFE